MNVKYMNIKKTVISVTVLTMASSQVIGCSTGSKLLSQFNDKKALKIEVSESNTKQQGTESSLLWEKLALISTNTDLRKAWDETLGTTGNAESKNGVLYVNAKGEQDSNNTLSVVVKNRAYLKLVENADTKDSLAEATDKVFSDIDSEDADTAFYMGVNSYFALSEDSGEYANPDKSLERSEFMSMVFRADTPVSDIKADSDFTSAVGKSDYNLYAQGVEKNSYLDASSKSLDNLTYNGVMTRAEAIYLVVSRYYGTELSSLTDTNLKSAKTYSDCKNGGDIATEQKFTGNDRAKAYELVYALQNPDDGMPTELYKAMVVAYKHNLLGTSTTESNWDEAISKVEAVKLIYTALSNTTENGITEFNSTIGTSDSTVSTEAGATSTDTESSTEAGTETTASGLETAPADYDGYNDIDENAEGYVARADMSDEMLADVAKIEADLKSRGCDLTIEASLGNNQWKLSNGEITTIHAAWIGMTEEEKEEAEKKEVAESTAKAVAGQDAAWQEILSVTK